VTIALLLGYIVSRFDILGIGHSYWILITIIAILKPAYATTKHRNLLRLFGTLAGAILAYIILYFIGEPTTLLIILLVSMIICFSLLKSNYFWAVLFYDDLYFPVIQLPETRMSISFSKTGCWIL
jgi:uncharacterized membrane protein YccC